MTRLLLLIAALTAGPVLADLIVDDAAACAGRSAGATCRTSDGRAGTCTVTGGELRCVSTQSARSLLPWVGVGLSFLAFLAASRLRTPPTPA